MSIAALVWQNILHKKWSMVLSILLLALGSGIISMLLLIHKSVTNKMDNDLRNTDLVVGAKGSPLQLVLSAIYQLDAPTGNISLSAVEKLAKNPLVEWWIPLLYGDAFKGSRIIGTTPAYISLYNGEIAEGNLFSKPMQVVAGAGIAKKAGMHIGSSFVGTHGSNGETHDQHPYQVVGILKPTGTMMDMLLLTNTATVWQVHHHEEMQDTTHHDKVVAHAHHKEEEAPHLLEDASVDEQQITAALFKFRSPMGIMTMPRMINAQTNLQAAVPAIEVRRLLRLMSVGTDTLNAVGAAIMVVSAFSIFIALYLRLKDRQYEMALMRTMGCPRIELLWLVLGEGLLIACIGGILGILLSRVGLLILQQFSASQFYLSLHLRFIPDEGGLMLIVIAIGAMAAFIPALKAFGLNISKTLANEK